MSTTDDTSPRALTRDEIRSKFLAHVRAMVRYWAKQPGTAAERCEGVAFSVLTMLDGCAADLPAFRIVADPHPDDRAFREEQGENWYPDASDGIDIGGALHEALGSCSS